MKSAARMFAISLLAVLADASSVQAQSFDIVKVMENVYAGIARPGVLCNGAFIVNRDEVLVVDTHLRPSWARDLIAEVRKVTDKPVRYVVNTHWHGDHTHGNQAYVQAFGGAVEYLAQHWTRDDIIGKAIPSIQTSVTRTVPENIARLEKMLAEGKDQQGKELTAEQRTGAERSLASQKSYLEELKTIQITLPTITFEKSLILYRTAPDGSERPIHIYYFGKGHTRGDVVVYLPNEKLLFTGDLLTNGVPFARDGYPSLWVTALEGARKLDFVKVLSGHGPVQDGKVQMERAIGLLKDVVAGVKEGIAAGKTAEEIAKTLDLEKHKAGFAGFDQGIGLLITRAHQEQTGTLPYKD